MLKHIILIAISTFEIHFSHEEFSCQFAQKNVKRIELWAQVIP